MMYRNTSVRHLDRPLTAIGTAADEGAFIREPFLKRPFDLLLSGIGLVLTAPLWILFTTWIWLDDGRPILFQQMRIGINGRLFRAMKFRSMVHDPKREAVQATQGDSRITRVGRLMRKTAMDELPQIWNIFKGDMSFVGPRSQPEKEIVRVKGEARELRIREVPGFALRQRVRPGLTGVAQIYAPRQIGHRNKFRYDLIYVRRVIRCGRHGLLGSLDMFMYDLRLILQSCWTTMRGRWEV